MNMFSNINNNINNNSICYELCKNCKEEINDNESQLSYLGLCYNCETMYYNNDINRCNVCNNFTENWNNINDLTVCNCCLTHVRNNMTYNRIYENKKSKLLSKGLYSRKKTRIM